MEGRRPARRCRRRSSRATSSSSPRSTTASSTPSRTTGPTARRPGGRRPRPRRSSRYHKTEGSPAASTAGDRRRADRLVLRLVRAVLLRPAGKELWKYEMPTAVTHGDFGTGTSPVLADGLVVLAPRRDEGRRKSSPSTRPPGLAKWEKKRTVAGLVRHAVVWDTPAGKQVVAAGHGRMIGYDLKTGDEKWSRGRHAVRPCCTTPVVADGMLVLRRLVARRPGRQGFKMPTFDDLLKEAGDKDDGLSHEGGGREDLVEGLLRQQRREQGRQDHPRRVGRGPQVHGRGEEQRVRASSPAAAAT